MSLRAFISDEDAAVSIDFIVLTAAVIAVTIAFGVQFADETSALEDAVGAKVLERAI